MKRVFSWLFPRDLAGSHADELRVAYAEEISRTGHLRARVWLVFQALSIAAHSTRLMLPASLVLVRRTGRLALRQLRSNTGYSILNVTGLALGLAAFMLLALFARFETSYDSFHSASDRIYRVNRSIFEGETAAVAHAQTAGALGDFMRRSFPEVESLVRVRGEQAEPFRVGQNSFRTEVGFLVDSTFFDVFDFRLTQGFASQALTAPFSIVLTESLAQRFFGDEPALGRVVEFGEENLPMTVTGVVEAPPANSHLQFEYLISWETSLRPNAPRQFGNYNNWLTLQMGTYVSLVPGATSVQVEARFPAVMDEFLADRKHRYGFYLEPLNEVHLSGSQVRATLDPNPGNRPLILLLMVVGGLILGIAYINFVNLATARAIERSKEVGVRKAIGATKGQLLTQFVGEAMVMSASAMAIALTLVAFGRPILASFAGHAFPVPRDSWPFLLLLALGTIGVSGLAVGLYPALILSRFRAGAVISSRVSAAGGPGWLRQLLVIGQFSASFVLMVGTLVVMRQTTFMSSKSLGFNAEQLVQIRLTSDLVQRFDTFKDLLEAHPDVLSVSHATGGPSEGAWGMDYLPEGAATDEFRNLRSLGVADDWLSHHGIQVLEGPEPKEAFGAESLVTQVYINETLRDELLDSWGLPDVLGRGLTIGSRDRDETTIAGVVSDFHLRSVDQVIPPLIIWGTSRGSLMAVRISTDNAVAALDHVQATWTAMGGTQPIQTRFVDDTYRAFYEGDRRLMKVLGAFAGIAIVIALLGLFGLTAYLSQQRRKEIGVRKVLGATPGQIVLLLARSFALLVGVAVAVATPIAYLMASTWLDSFPYRFNLGVDLFATGGIVLVSIAMLTVLYQALRAAKEAPVACISS